MLLLGHHGENPHHQGDTDMNNVTATPLERIVLTISVGDSFDLDPIEHGIVRKKVVYRVSNVLGKYYVDALLRSPFSDTYDENRGWLVAHSLYNMNDVKNAINDSINSWN